MVHYDEFPLLFQVSGKQTYYLLLEQDQKSLEIQLFVFQNFNKMCGKLYFDFGIKNVIIGCNIYNYIFPLGICFDIGDGYFLNFNVTSKKSEISEVPAGCLKELSL